MNEAILHGMTRGWPKARPGRVSTATAKRLTKLTIELTPTAQARVRLVGSWGDQALDRLGHEIAATMLASVKNEKLTESQRIDARNSSSSFVPATKSRPELLDWMTAGHVARLAAGLVDVVAASKAAAASGRRSSRHCPSFGRVRSRVIKALLGRSDWVPAFVEASSTTPPCSGNSRSTRSRRSRLIPIRKSRRRPAAARAWWRPARSRSTARDRSARPTARSRR